MTILLIPLQSRNMLHIYEWINEWMNERVGVELWRFLGELFKNFNENLSQVFKNIWNVFHSQHFSMILLVEFSMRFFLWNFSNTGTWIPEKYSGSVLGVKIPIFLDNFFNLVGFFEKKIPKHSLKIFRTHKKIRTPLKIFLDVPQYHSIHGY